MARAVNGSRAWYILIMASQPITYVTREQYLAFDRAAERRSEYIDGQIVAMSGASDNHMDIVTNTVVALHPQLRTGTCRIRSNDMRVFIGQDYYYPDLVIVCDEARYADSQRDVLLNPRVVIEVLSPSTASFDRGTKFANYRGIDSLMEYLLISQDKIKVEHYVKQPNGDWLLSERSGPADVLNLPSVGATLNLADVYDRIEF